MDKRLRILLVSLLFIGGLFSLLKGFDQEPAQEVTSKQKVASALIKEGISPSGVIISNGSEMKRALNIQGPDPPNASRLVLVIYPKPLQLTFPEGVNRVIFTALEADDTLDGVLAFDSTHRYGKETALIIYGSRERADKLATSGLSPAQIYNQWDIFEVTKLDVSTPEEVIADSLALYDVEVRALGVFTGGDLKAAIPMEVENDSLVAYIEYMPREGNHTVDPRILAVVEAAFQAVPSLDVVLVNDLRRMEETGNISVYSMTRETYEQIDYDQTVEEILALLDFNEYPVRR
jgi:hypothetical protein